MTNHPELCDLDQQWLLERHPDASEAEIDKFLEKVAVIWADFKLDDETARKMAAFEVFGGQMVDKGSKAWADVPDAGKWLEDLRGG